MEKVFKVIDEIVGSLTQGIEQLKTEENEAIISRIRTEGGIEGLQLLKAKLAEEPKEEAVSEESSDSDEK